MIGPQHEQPRSGPGDFRDVVSADFCDGERGTFGLVRISRAPNERTAAVIGLLFEPGELLAQIVEPALDMEIPSWKRVEAGGARLTTDKPLERWTAALDAGGSGFELSLRASSPPIELGDPPTPDLAREAGISRYEQLCEVRGSVQASGRTRRISCTGRRVHAWGAPDWDRLAERRSLYAASAPDSGIVIVATRPRGSSGHGDDSLAGCLVQSESEPQAFEEVRLSTVRSGTGLTRKAGLELYLPGDEFPRRFGGEAACGTSVDAGGRVHDISFLRWSIEGVPAYGSYETVKRR